MASIYQIYKGRNSQPPEDPNKAILWSAEQMYAENYIGDLFKLQDFVCAFVSKWNPYERSEILLPYLENSPYKDQLAKTYEL